MSQPHLERTHSLPESSSPTASKTLNVIISTLAQRQPLPKTTKPPLPERKREEFYAILLGGTLLAISAGYMNAVAILDTGFTVSHVTGTTATTGIHLLPLFSSASSHVFRYCAGIGQLRGVSHQAAHLVVFYFRELLVGSHDQLHFVPPRQSLWSHLPPRVLYSRARGGC